MWNMHNDCRLCMRGEFLEDKVNEVEVVRREYGSE